MLKINVDKCNTMRIIILLVVILFSISTFSQVGIGTTSPDGSSILDINSNNTGLLIPRVSLSDITNGSSPINSPAVSLLVYNTNASTAGGNGVGYYYWNGTIWVKLQTNVDEKWSRNSGTGYLFPSTLTDRVGIGLNNPSEMLDIAGRVKIADGNQSTGKVLTSDANGVGTWQKVGINNINVSLTNLGISVPYTTANFLQTGASITLPPGKFAINVTMLLTNTTGTPTPDNSSFWLRSTFSDSSGINPVSSTDILGGRLISGNLPGSSLFSLLSGTIIINNTSSLPKTYYYVAGNVHIINTTDTLLKIGGNLNENSIIAYKLE